MERVFRVVLNDSGSRYMAEMMNKLEQQYGAEEIGTAEWIEDTLTKFKVVCSKCGARNFGADRAYCPRCGRKMEEGSDG